MPRIALVDDDRNLLTSLSLLLGAEGYEVNTYVNPRVALQDMRRCPPDLAVIDMRMPQMDGLDLLQKLRADHDMPVVFLSASRSETDEILSLRLGADDFLRKPFSAQILVQRLRGCLRRAEAAQTPEGGIDGDPVVERGPLVMDPQRHLVTWRGKPVTLTPVQFTILRFLAEKTGFVRSRDQVIAAVHGPGFAVEDRTADSQIKRIRSKLRAVDPDFSAIETLYGLGYRFVPPTA
ncbi:MAG: response regulator transcription factor [Rhodobacteraceae bacterium]|nr:response regulator transcription factor [Paracoccaceae bacterium]